MPAILIPRACKRGIKVLVNARQQKWRGCLNRSGNTPNTNLTHSPKHPPSPQRNPPPLPPLFFFFFFFFPHTKWN